MTRLSISDIAEKYLTRWLEGLLTGELQLGALPHPVADFYHAGVLDGRETRDTELRELHARIDRLERECDRLWAHAFLTKNERRERLLARLDEGLEAATEETWQRLEQDLAVMAGRRQHLGIEGAHNAPVGSRNDGSSSGTSGLRREAA